MKKLSFPLAVVIVLFLTSCTASAQTGGVSEVLPELDEGAVAPVQEIPSGIPASLLDCGTLGGLISPFGDGLYPASSSVLVDSEVLCIWSTNPDVSILEGGDLDVALYIRHFPLDTVENSEFLCSEGRVVESAPIDQLSGCVLSLMSSSGESAANLPGFSVTIDVTCDRSTFCDPILPGEYTDAAAIAALERLSTALFQ